MFLRHTSKNYLGAAWLVLTRMKEQKKQAFERLRTFSKQVGLKEYAEACDRDLIEALDKSVWRYAIKAIGNKLMKR